MNAERLLQHYEQIADAPDAIARLRRFILDLAVRGKLVPQNLADEPASELLKRIASEKARLVKAGKLRERPSLPVVADSDAPFPIPSTWEWVRFANIADFSAGRTPPRGELSFWNGGDHAWVSIADLADGQLLTSTKETVSDKAREQIFRSPPEAAGTILMSFKLTIGKIARLGISAFHNEAIISIRPYFDELDPYLFLVLPLFARRGETKGAIKGATLNRDSISNILVPLPPLAEQRGIVAKVDELMALCDQLEAARTERETKRDRLAAASLARLNTPDPETFRDDARFALDALPALTARPDEIKQLRQTILNLAVRGKLVPQGPEDESAEELLKRVQLCKPRSRQPTTKIDPRNAAYDIPATWTWASLEQLVVFGPQNGISPRPTSRDDAPKAITLTATTSGKFNPAYYKRVEGKFPPESDFWLSEGDLLFQRGNTPEYVGMAAIYEGPPHTFLFPDLIIKVRVSDDVDLSYVHLASISPSGRRYLTENASGAQATMPKINQTTLLSLPIPLPPLAEQHRIVARVDELMALCDQLEKSLTSADDTRKRLLDALLAEALAPVDAEALQEAAE